MMTDVVLLKYEASLNFSTLGVSKYEQRTGPGCGVRLSVFPRARCWGVRYQRATGPCVKLSKGQRYGLTQASRAAQLHGQLSENRGVTKA